ncbi:UPF0182 family membrane protein [Fuchsiella alkaliacetigena]|uniref:UPF0182 family membrane protein n=1 Tax=Fuchsiella alkaliacetigena TaxID=957042 RepID=UPI00200AA3DD|nr:UPF0182 family protein [Fuchsiella alkaliacetigena]MCK8823749.1 UPF0182 family protein [Fuchsiella alkaliacetigena]
MKKLTTVLALIGLAFILFFLIGNNLFTNWLWFESIGYLSVFTTILLTQNLARIIFSLLLILSIFVNLLFTKQEILDYKARDKFVMTDSEELFVDEKRSILDLVNKKNLTWIFLGISILIGLLFASFSSNLWQLIQQYFNAATFEITDPIFNNDLSFYIFKLPFYEFIYRYLMLALVVNAFLAVIIYLFINSDHLADRKINLSSRVKYHLTILASLFMLLKAGGYWLARYDLLYSSSGVVFGAGYTDINAQLLALTVLTVLAVLVSIFMLVNLFTENFKLVAGGVGVLIVASIVLGGIYPAVIQRFRVEPNELAAEMPYIENNIELTQQAYNLADVKERRFSFDNELTAEDLQNNQGTVSNIRLWDPRPLASTYHQLQGMRNYYNFNDIDVDRYDINGEYRQVMLGARELNKQNLPERAKTWVNEKLKYTHGFGLAMSYVNLVTSDGQPEFLIKDLPPRSEFQLEVEEPRLYFGEETDDYVIVNTDVKEFDYPSGEREVNHVYQGSGGVQLSSMLRRAAFALRFGSANLILNDDMHDESRLQFSRNITERVNKIAPFLTYDGDPYLVLGEDGKLYWIQDAYTTTDRYPYSEPYNQSINYIRNSVKVVVDAYEGEVDFYIIDEDDPVVETYSRIFPELFTDFAEMPADLQKHIRYPEDLFKIQSQKYQAYHMEDPAEFYNQEDLWTVPNEKFAGNTIQMEPYYIIMDLPGEEVGEEFVLMLPYTPDRRDNMISWLAARSDGDNYGELVLYEFPEDRLAYGPMQIESRIDQDSEISERLSLWDQQGSRVIRGNLLVIPIENSVLYVEPVYLESEQSQIPELRRVIVAYDDQVVMANNLDLALAEIFGEQLLEDSEELVEELDFDSPEMAEVETELRSMQQLVGDALSTYSQAQSSLQEGDWGKYGELIDELEGILKELEKKSDL